MTVSFALQKLLSFRWSHLFNVALIVCATGVICKKWSPVPMCCRLQSTSHFLFFQVHCGQIYIEVFNPFGLEFCAWYRYGSIFIHLQVDIQLYEHYLLNMLSFFHCIILAPLSKNQVFIGFWVNIQVFDLIPLVIVSVFMPIPSCFHYCNCNRV